MKVDALGREEGIARRVRTKTVEGTWGVRG